MFWANIDKESGFIYHPEIKFNEARMRLARSQGRKF